MGQLSDGLVAEVKDVGRVGVVCPGPLGPGLVVLQIEANGLDPWGQPKCANRRVQFSLHFEGFPCFVGFALVLRDANLASFPLTHDVQGIDVIGTPDPLASGAVVGQLDRVTDVDVSFELLDQLVGARRILHRENVEARVPGRTPLESEETKIL